MSQRDCELTSWKKSAIKTEYLNIIADYEYKETYMFVFQNPLRSDMKHLLKICSNGKRVKSPLTGGMEPSTPIASTL